MRSQALIGALLLSAAPSAEVNYRSWTLELEGTLLGVECLDVDLDGRLELCLAVLGRDKSRELRFHRLVDQRVELQPFRVVPVRDDAIAYGLAELREDPGHELFFLTKSGVWSYSLSKEGYRGNVERVLQSELIYDVPDPDALPYWRYVLPGSPRDGLLLPTPQGFALFGPVEGKTTPYGPLTDFKQLGRPEVSINEEALDYRGSLSLGPSGVRFDSGGPRDSKAPFMEPADGRGDDFLSNQRRVSAPALLDLDGDGQLDMVLRDADGLRVHFHKDASFAEEPDRLEAFPDYIKPGYELSFVDLDGDGDRDLVARSNRDEDSSSLASETFVVLLLINDGVRLLPEKPSQVLRFEAGRIVLELLDVNADGRMDLGVRKFEMPSMAAALSEFELKLTDVLFLGESGARPLARKPVLKSTRSFTGENITRLATNRTWKLDCTGDGIADQVELDIDGNITVIQVERTKKFFGGHSWNAGDSAWYRTQAASKFKRLQVLDLNDDGLGDILSPGTERLIILLSQAPA